MEPPDPRPARPTLRATHLALFWGGLAIGVVLLAVAARTTDVRAQLAFLGSFGLAAWAWIALAYLLEVGHVAVRARRWSMLLPEPRPRPGRMFEVMALGYLYNNVVPRSGEAVRVWLIGRSLPRLGFGGTAVTIVADRLIDVGMVLVMTTGLVVLSPLSLDDVAGSGRAFAAVLVVAAAGAVGIAAVVYAATALERLAARVLAALPERFARALTGPTGGLFAALHGFRRLSRPAAAGLVFWTTAEYLIVIVMWQLIARGFGVSMPIADVAFVIAASGFGAMVPSGPGNVGSMVLLMSLAAQRTVLGSHGPAYAVVCFGAYFVVRTLLGLAFLVQATRRSRAPAAAPESAADLAATLSA